VIILMKVISYSRIWKEEGAWLIVSHLQNLWIAQRAYLDLVPILTGEGVHRLLLEALLAF
jgi:hypothetical protein